MAASSESQMIAVGLTCHLKLAIYLCLAVRISDKSSLVARYFISLQAVDMNEMILIQQIDMINKLVFIP